jgi:hypothetical protein
MPVRIQSNLGGMRRIYPLRPRQQNVVPASARAGRGGAGGAAGGLFNPPDVTPTGYWPTDLGKAINAIAQTYQQNKLANRLMNTENPPRAAWVGGTAPAAGVPTTGTAPIKGGVQEMQFQQQLAADAAAKQQQDLAGQLQRTKIAAQLALAGKRGGAGGGGNAQRWQQYLGGDQGSTNVPQGTKKGGKPAPYEPGSIDPNTDPNADKFQIVQADFDAKYGKGAYARIAPNLANATVDDNGNYTINAPRKKPDDPPTPIMTLPADQAKYWLSRYNAASVRSGQQPIFSDKFPSANPNSGQPAGSEVNPFKPANQLEARSLPYNSFFVDPNSGQVGQKLPEEKQPPPEKQTSQVDTGDQGGQLAIGDQSVQPPPPNMATGVGLDQTGGAVPDVGSASLADAIARAKAQDQLQGLA